MFPYIGNNHPNWLIFFRGVQTTNQLSNRDAEDLRNTLESKAFGVPHFKYLQIAQKSEHDSSWELNLLTAAHPPNLCGCLKIGYPQSSIKNPWYMVHNCSGYFYHYPYYYYPQINFMPIWSQLGGKAQWFSCLLPKVDTCFGHTHRICALLNFPFLQMVVS